ncbi:MAG: rod shape-determining protein RodA [Gemmatimonadetes bacterium]|jgi:rod shape determining protein RodA|nr:rod shape-determining protein RodA [Gemmatimonadota bacterium]
MSVRRFPIDWSLVCIGLLLSLYGISIVYSAGQTDIVTNVAKLWRSQVIWFLISLAAAYGVTRCSVRMLDWLTWPAYYVTVAMLVLLLFIGKGAGTAASSKSWLAIGGFRIGQPSELAKITVVLALAKVLAGFKEPPKSLLELWKPALVVGIPWALIMKQPDLGTGIVFVGFAFAMLFWVGVSWPLLVLVASPVVSLILAFNTQLWGAWFLLLVALVLWYKPYMYEGIFLVVLNVIFGVVSPIVWEKLAPYQQKRLLVFINPDVDRRLAGYHVIQSQIAIGSGGWFGKGYTQGTQKRLAFLPAQHTDFIFAVVGEELGFLGVMVAFFLFLLLFIRVTKIAERANDSFSSLIAFGLLASWMVHVLVNVGMTLNLMPITGIPLPFFSYGGSFMLASWLAIGLLVRIAAEGRGGRSGPFAV